LSEERRTGHCLCGRVRFETRGRLRDVLACHCVQCRRQSGHHVAATAVGDGELTVSGADNLTWYAASPDARRAFCRDCGSLLFWKHKDSTSTSIMAGAFDEPSGLKLGEHIFCDEKGSYYEIDDGLPRHGQWKT
jgi:hypothetical protein